MPDNANDADNAQSARLLMLLAEFSCENALWEKKLVDENRWSGIRYDIAIFLNTSGGRWVWEDGRAAWVGFPILRM